MHSIFISRTRERQKENGERTDEINQTNGHSVSNERTKRFKRTYVFAPVLFYIRHYNLHPAIPYNQEIIISHSDK